MVMNALRAVVLGCVLVGCGVPEEEDETGVAQQALKLVVVQGEAMSGGSGVVSNSAASGGLVMRLYPLAAASAGVTAGAPGTSLLIRAYRNGCTVGAPVQVKVNATVVGTVLVTSASLQSLTLAASVPATASTVTLTNLNATTCRVFVDYFIVDGPVAPPPPPVVTTYQAEDAAFVGAGLPVGAVRRFSANGTATRSITTTAPATQVTVLVNSVRCDINTPRVVVALDGVTVIDAVALSGSWQQHGAVLASIPAGAHTISVSYPNDSDVPPCNSHLDVDWVQLTTQP